MRPRNAPADMTAPEMWSEAEQVRRTPYGTIAGTALLLLLFVGVVYWVDSRSGSGAAPADGPAPEQKLADLRAADAEALTTYGEGPRPGEYRMPVDTAVDRLVRRAEQDGALPYPLPAEKKEEKK